MTNRSDSTLTGTPASSVRKAAMSTPPSMAAPSQRARLVLLIHLGFVALTTGLVGYTVVFAVPGRELIGLYSSLLLLSFAWSLGTWFYVRKTLFDLYGMFVILAFLFHGSFALLRLVGSEAAIYLLPDLRQSVLAQSILAVLVGFVSMHLGALLSESRQRPHRQLGEPIQLSRTVGHDSGSSRLLSMGILLVLLSFPFMLMEIREGVGLVSSGGYRALFIEESGDGPLRVLGNIARDFFLTGAFFLMAASGRRRSYQVVSVTLIGIFAAYNLYLGHRAYAVLPVVAAVWLWHQTVRKLPLTLLAVPGLLTLLYALPLVRQLRGLTGGSRIAISDLHDYFTSLPDAVTSLLGEAGGTLMTVGYTIELVPAVRSFETGATYVGAIVNAIPMMSWSRPYGFATDWLAWTVKPEWAANGFGFGYSFIAEAYLNFGWIGIPIVCFLIGFLAVSFVRWAGTNAARLAVVAVFIPSFLFFARGESIDLFRPLLWRGLLPYLVLVVTIKLSSKNSGRDTVTTGAGLTTVPDE